MGILGFGHAGYVVSDWERSVDFYQNKLGFEIVADFETPERRIMFLKMCDGQSIELFSGGADTIRLTKKTIGFAHTCLIVENMKELAPELKAKGVQFKNEPNYREDGSANVTILDPDGNEFELMQRGPGAKF